MNVIHWFKRLFNKQDFLEINPVVNGGSQFLDIELLAINSAINLIASLISKCEFQVFIKGDKTKKDEYYLWNIEPNQNQNSSAFIQKLVSTLLYNNEALVIENNGQLYVADSYSIQEYAFFDDVFTGVTIKNFTFNKNFKMSEVLFFKLQNDDIRILLTNVLGQYESILSNSISKYSSSGGEKGILEISSIATGDQKFQEKFKKLMEERFKTYFESKNAVLPLFEGYKYNPSSTDSSKKASNEINDIKGITDEIYNRVAQAFKIPPALLKGDIGNLSEVFDITLTTGIDPITSMISEEVTRKRFGKSSFTNGSYVKVDTTTIKHIDIFSISESIDKLIASGTYNIDEIRVKAGDSPLNTDFSKKYFITKNYQDINDLEGGANIGQ